MRFIIRHPRNPLRRAGYGWDGPSGLGFFVEIRERALLIVRYDALHQGRYDVRQPLWGALIFLVAGGFFSQDDLEESLMRAPLDLPEEMPRKLRRVAVVVAHFREAAD